MLDDSKISTLFSIAHKKCVYRNSVFTVPTILIMIYVGLKALATRDFIARLRGCPSELISRFLVFGQDIANTQIL